MQGPFLEKCCEKPSMRIIKASQSPPPPRTHGTIKHFEPERCRENPASVTLRASSFAHLSTERRSIHLAS